MKMTELLRAQVQNQFRDEKKWSALAGVLRFRDYFYFLVWRNRSFLRRAIFRVLAEAAQFWSLSTMVDHGVPKASITAALIGAAQGGFQLAIFQGMRRKSWSKKAFSKAPAQDDHGPGLSLFFSSVLFQALLFYRYRSDVFSFSVIGMIVVARSVISIVDAAAFRYLLPYQIKSRLYVPPKVVYFAFLGEVLSSLLVGVFSSQPSRTQVMMLVFVPVVFRCGFSGWMVLNALKQKKVNPVGWNPGTFLSRFRLHDIIPTPVTLLAFSEQTGNLILLFSRPFSSNLDLWLGVALFKVALSQFYRRVSQGVDVEFYRWRKEGRWIEATHHFRLMLRMIGIVFLASSFLVLGLHQLNWISRDCFLWLMWASFSGLNISLISTVLAAGLEGATPVFWVTALRGASVFILFLGVLGRDWLPVSLVLLEVATSLVLVRSLVVRHGLGLLTLLQWQADLDQLRVDSEKQEFEAQSNSEVFDRAVMGVASVMSGAEQTLSLLEIKFERPYLKPAEQHGVLKRVFRITGNSSVSTWLPNGMGLRVIGAQMQNVNPVSLCQKVQMAFPLEVAGVEVLEATQVYPQAALIHSAEVAIPSLGEYLSLRSAESNRAPGFNWIAWSHAGWKVFKGGHDFQETSALSDQQQLDLSHFLRAERGSERGFFVLERQRSGSVYFKVKGLGEWVEFVQIGLGDEPTRQWFKNEINTWMEMCIRSHRHGVSRVPWVMPSQFLVLHRFMKDLAEKLEFEVHFEHQLKPSAIAASKISNRRFGTLSIAPRSGDESEAGMKKAG
jgi:hypothetical protein